jgi:phage FluMu protein Com
MPTDRCPRCSTTELVSELSQEWLKVSCPKCYYDFFLPPDYPTNNEPFYQVYET